MREDLIQQALLQYAGSCTLCATYAELLAKFSLPDTQLVHVYVHLSTNVGHVGDVLVR